MNDGWQAGSTRGEGCGFGGGVKRNCKFIYLFRNTTEPYGDAAGYALCECGQPVASHLSSSLDWARHDLGYEKSTWKHEKYAKHCPDGFELVWVACDDKSPGFVEALARNKAGGEEE